MQVLPSLLLLFASFALAQLQYNTGFRGSEVVQAYVEQPYLEKGGSIYLDYGGDTVVRNDRYIRLTQDKQGQRGRFFSKVPVDSSALQIEFEINIHGEASSIYGDGMAFWALSSPPAEGPVFGIQDRPTGLGILIDTYKNDRPGRAFPYIMAMVGDGNTPYDAAHDGAANELAGCSARGIYNNDRPTKGRITIVKGKFISLELNYKGKNEWEKCFETTAQLPESLYLGWSAQTGELSSNHDLVRSWVWELRSPPNSFAELDHVLNGRDQLVDAAGTSKKNTSSAGNGWGWFFIKLVLLVAVILGGYLGYGIYLSKKRNTSGIDPFYL